MVHIQDHMPWYSDFEREFSVGEAAKFLHDRITTSEEGHQISEWDVPLTDIEAFVQNLESTPTLR